MKFNAFIINGSFFSSKHKKQVVLINNSWIIPSPTPALQNWWGLEFCLFFKKWGRVKFSPKKREAGKLIEEWRLLRENKLSLEVRFVCKTSKLLLQSTKHCFLVFDDTSSCERIRGGIGWLAIGGKSSFSWILYMCHHWCGFCRQIYYLSWAAVKTSFWFTGKAAKR